MHSFGEKAGKDAHIGFQIDWFPDPAHLIRDESSIINTCLRERGAGVTLPAGSCPINWWEVLAFCFLH